MTILWLVVGLGAVLIAAKAMRNAGQAKKAHAPRPGEGMDRVESYGPPPGDWVSVHAGAREEMLVAQGLLDANGIPARIEGALPGVETRLAYSTAARLRVPPERAEEAAALLREQVVAGEPGDVGAE